MKTEQKIELTKKDNGIVEVLFITVYYKEDGSILTEERHRDTLTPTETERAKTMLNEYNLNILNAIWTDEVIETYQLQQQEKEELAQVATEESGF